MMMTHLGRLLFCFITLFTFSSETHTHAQLTATYSSPLSDQSIQVYSLLPNITVTPSNLAFYTITVNTITANSSQTDVLQGTTNSTSNLLSDLRITTPGNYTLNITGWNNLNTTNGTLTTSVISIIPGDAAKIMIIQQPLATYTAGESITIMAVITDQYNNTVNGIYPLDCTFQTQTSQNNQQYFITPIAPGTFVYSQTGSFDSLVTTAGNFTNQFRGSPSLGASTRLVISSGSFSTFTTDFIVTAGPSSTFNFDVFPTLTTVSTPTTIIISLRDTFNNTVTTAASTTITLTATSNAIPADVQTFTATTTNGVATFNTVQILKAGIYTFTASAPEIGNADLTSATTMTVQLGTITLTLTPPARNSDTDDNSVGVIFTVIPSFTVTATNNGGIPIAGVTIQITNNDIGSSLFAASSILTLVTDATGLVTFNNISITQAGTWMLQAATVPPSASSGLSTTSFTILILINAPATGVGFASVSPYNGRVIAGSPFSVLFQLQAGVQRTTNGADASVTLSLRGSDMRIGTLSGTLTRTTRFGRVNFDGLSIDRVPSSLTYVIVATVNGQDYDVTSVQMISGALNRMEIDTSSAPLPQPLTATYFYPITVNLFDANGNRLSLQNTVTSYSTNLTISLTSTSDPNTAITSNTVFKCAANSGVTSANSDVAPYGQASCEGLAAVQVSASAVTFNVAVGAVGTYTFTISTANGQNGGNTNVISVTSAPFTVTVGPAYSLRFAVPRPDNVIAGDLLNGVVVHVYDGAGQRVLDYSQSITCTAVVPISGFNIIRPQFVHRLTDNIIVKANQGMATFGFNMTIATTNAVIMCEAPFIQQIFSEPFIVLPAPAPYTLWFHRVDSPTLAGESFTVQVSLRDRFSNVAHNHPDGMTVSLVLLNQYGNQTVEVGSVGTLVNRPFISGIASFTSLIINRVGIYTFNATSTNFATITSSQLIIQPNVPTRLDWAAAPPSSWILGDFRVLTLIAYDAYGNLANTRRDVGNDYQVSLHIRNSTNADLGTTYVTQNPVRCEFGSPCFNFSTTITTLCDACYLEPIITLPTFAVGLPNVATSNSSTFNVIIGPAAGLSWGNFPAGGPPTIAQQTIPDFQIAISDVARNLVTVDGTLITLTLITNASDLRSNSSTPVYGTLSRSTVGGVATFTNLRINVAGTYYFLATAPNLKSSVSLPFVINGGYPVRVVFTQQPANVTNTTTPFSGVQIALYDELDNFAGDWLTYTYSISLVYYDALDSNIPILGNPNNNMLNQSTTSSSKMDVRPIDLLNQQGLVPAPMYALFVSVKFPPVTDVTVYPTPLQAYSTPFTVMMDERPTSLVIVDQPSSWSSAYASILPYEKFSVKLQILNQNNNIATRFPVTVTVNIQDYSAIGVKAWNGAYLTGETEVQTVNGIAHFRDLAFSDAGFYKLTFSCPYETNVTSVISYIVDVIAAEPGVVRKMVVINQPLHGISNIGIEPIIVQLQDALGKLVSSENSRSINVHLNRAPDQINARFTAGFYPTVEFADTIRFTAVNGIITIGGLTVDLSGNYTLTLQSHGLHNVTTSNIWIRAGEPVGIQWVKEPTKISPLESFNISCTLYDDMNNLVLDYDGPLQLLINGTESSAYTYVRTNLPNGVIQFTYTMTRFVPGIHTMSIEALGLKPDRKVDVVLGAFPAHTMKWVINPVGPQFNDSVPLRAGRFFSASVYVTNWLGAWDNSFTVIAALQVLNKSEITKQIPTLENGGSTTPIFTSALVVNSTYTWTNLRIKEVGLVRLRVYVYQPNFPSIPVVELYSDMFRILPDNIGPISLGYVDFPTNGVRQVMANTFFNVTALVYDQYKNVYDLPDINWLWHVNAGVCRNDPRIPNLLIGMGYDNCGGASPFATVGIPIGSQFHGAAPPGTLGADPILIASNGTIIFTNLIFRSLGAYTGFFSIEINGYQDTVNPNSYTVMQRAPIQVTPYVAPASGPRTLTSVQFIQQPNGPTPGRPNITCAVSLMDDFSRIMYDAAPTSMTVSLIVYQSKSTNPVLGGTLTRTTVNGTALFNDLTVSAFGKYQLSVTFTVQGMSATSILSNNFTVGPSQLVITPITTSLYSQQVIPTFTVSIQDTFGNIISDIYPNPIISVQVQQVAPRMMPALTARQWNQQTYQLVSGSTQQLAINGTGKVTFNGLSINQAGIYKYKLHAEAGDLMLDYVVPQNVTVIPTAPTRVYISNLTISTNNYRSISFGLQLQDMMFNNVTMSKGISLSLRNSGHSLSISSITLNDQGYAQINDAVISKCVPYSSTFNLVASADDIIPTSKTFTIYNPTPDGRTSCPAAPASSSSNTLSTGAIIGIAVGGSVGLILLLVLACFCCRATQRRQLTDFLSRKRNSTIPMTEMSKADL